ncbi:energy transducer TonB [Sphingomonas mesophila]|uniref:energy transducer TonB n=1 Tax=Sphingomonas mesophila TaxID=2303576 RepID=UPI000E56D687|nr:energy transducer TonB [Sphingomonas mesophila]
MYRPSLKPRDRFASLALVGALHAGLILALLNLSGAVDIVSRQDLTQLIDIADPPEQQVVEVKPAAREEGEASPPNIESKATPVVDLKPKIVLPTPNPLPVSPTPKEGTQTTQGAAPVPGPGTGAGGVGTGTGAGGSGSGPGGGGEDGIAAVRARLATPPLRGRDFPRQLLASWPRGADIFTRLRVDENGVVIECDVMRGTGYPGLDAEVCAIVRQRVRFTPAVNRRGQRVADWFGYRQEAPR